MAHIGQITDVPGFRVGQVQRQGDGWLTGVSVLMPPPGAIAVADVGGGGPASHELSGLRPGCGVLEPNAIVLTGGSAYGLVTAHGVMRYLAERGRGFQAGAKPGEIVPIVPTSGIFDLGRGGAWGNHPTPEMGYEAAAAADACPLGGPVARGSVGAGTGALISRGRYRGGAGTASYRLMAAIHRPVWMGAFAVVNAVGTPVAAGRDPLSPALGFAPRARGGAAVPRVMDDAGGSPSGEGTADAGSPAGRGAGPDPAEPGPAMNTCLVVVATDAALDPGQLDRLCRAGHDALARSFDPIHTLADGDTVYAVSTRAVLPPADPAIAGTRAGAQAGDGAAATVAAGEGASSCAVPAGAALPAWGQASLMAIQTAAARVVEAAVRDALTHATPATTPAGSWEPYPFK
jgi:L-aminopeptidase/D-esterase-like protein